MGVRSCQAHTERLVAVEDWDEFPWYRVLSGVKIVSDSS
jgi:hypothetical protein